MAQNRKPGSITTPTLWDVEVISYDPQDDSRRHIMIAGVVAYDGPRDYVVRCAGCEGAHLTVNSIRNLTGVQVPQTFTTRNGAGAALIRHWTKQHANLLSWPR